MSHKSALASLTAQYTDSENEDEQASDENGDSTDTEKSTESQVIIVQRKSVTPLRQEQHSAPADRKPTDKKSSHMRRLVSYNDDNPVSDGDSDESNDDASTGTSANQNVINMDISEDDGTSESKATDSNAAGDSVKDGQDRDRQLKRDKTSEYGFSLPPEPKGKCPPELQDKISNMHAKLKQGMDMNRLIQDRKEFRNPSIYEKLIQFCDINELGTNYPPEIYDPLQWGKESFYEELALAQKLEMEKRERERKENLKTELVVAAAKKAEEDAKRRKSKWDQPAPGVTNVTTAPVQVAKTAGLVQPTLTTNATGTKGTVISAFGSLPKKPKV